MYILKIGAVWCSGCLIMRPRFAEIEKENPWLKTQYFDFDSSKDALAKYHVESGVLPVFIFIDKDGEEFLRLNGEIEKEALLKVIEENKDR